MKAVFPVTLHNAPLYEQLSRLFEKIGPNKRHTMFVVSCPAAMEAAQTFAESCKRLFLDVEVASVANVVEKGDMARNAMFRDAMYLLETKKNVSPWIWMENAYPMDRHWLDIVQDEWNVMPREKAFLGCIEKSYRYATAKEIEALREKRPEIGDGPFFEPIGRHMRFGAYPADFHNRSKAFHFLSQTATPFEVYLQDEIVPFCHESSTMRTLWASVNYEVVNQHSGVRGEQSPQYESAIRANEKTFCPIKGTAILHGCRDGSLGMAIMGRRWTEDSSVWNPKTPVPANLESKYSEAQDELRALRAEVARLKAEELKKEIEEQKEIQSDDEEPAKDAEAAPEEVGTQKAVEEEAAPEAVKSEPEPMPAAPPKRKPGRPRKVKV